MGDWTKLRELAEDGEHGNPVDMAGGLDVLLARVTKLEEDLEATEAELLLAKLSEAQLSSDYRVLLRAMVGPVPENAERYKIIDGKVQLRYDHGVLNRMFGDAENTQYQLKANPDPWKSCEEKKDDDDRLGRKLRAWAHASPTIEDPRPELSGEDTVHLEDPSGEGES